MKKPKQNPDLQTLKARYVFPVTGEPIPDGAVTIQGHRIVAVEAKTPHGEARDLGNVAILPGLVNAHTHLEFSDLPEPLGEPGMDFVDWIGRVVEFRRQVADTPRRPVGRGLREAVRSGTTTLGEIAQPGWDAQVIENAPVDTTVFLELIAATVDRARTANRLAQRHLESGAGATWRAGLSPHAPYSVRPELLDAVASQSASARIPVAFHLAESREELELIRCRTGPFRQFLEQLGAWEPDAFPPGTRPLDYLRTLSTAYRSLVIHGNYLDHEEIAFLGEHAERMALVYCPRTHARFAHTDYRLERMLSVGVTVALGTDGRASSPDLSILSEMRFVAEKHQAIGCDVILKLATICGARALGVDDEVGSLEPGKDANLAIVALPDRSTANPYDLLLDSHEPVVATWYRGVVSGEW